ncbi:nuclear transport factor 2 family protein [Streptomyces sp. NBC_01727]|uniref:nuclear transport factor 2 family protein n=1 Tax=Streptomyces sp. NBC_01727 TaxID=2975924 RepID=UPI002E0EE295|nr:nuclear transport factor 2 family protein [Streptomyces sp. NBC_01727]
MIDQNRIVVERYLEAWNATDATLRAKAVASVWDLSGIYNSSMANAKGHDDLVGLIAGFRARFPGALFRLAGEVREHDDIISLEWEFLDPDRETLAATGRDIIVVAANGRIQAVHSTFSGVINERVTGRKRC